MASPKPTGTKRKRKSLGFTTNKRRKSATAAAADADADDDWFSVKRIIAQRHNKYQVEWEEPNPQTGEPYEPSWVTKSDLTPALLAEWNETKDQRKAEEEARTGKKSRVSLSSRKSVPKPATPRPRPGRKSAAAASASKPSPSRRQSARLQPPHLSNSPSPDAPSSLSPLSSLALSSPSPAPPAGRIPSVVQDSQSSNGSASFIPSTQEPNTQEALGPATKVEVQDTDLSQIAPSHPLDQEESQELGSADNLSGGGYPNEIPESPVEEELDSFEHQTQQGPAEKPSQIDRIPESLTEEELDLLEHQTHQEPAERSSQIDQSTGEVGEGSVHSIGDFGEDPAHSIVGFGEPFAHQSQFQTGIQVPEQGGTEQPSSSVVEPLEESLQEPIVEEREQLEPESSYLDTDISQHQPAEQQTAEEPARPSVHEHSLQEPVREEQESIVEEPESIVEEPESIVEEPESIVEEPESIVEEPESIVEEPEPIFEEPEPAEHLEPEPSYLETDISTSTSQQQVVEQPSPPYFSGTPLQEPVVEEQEQLEHSNIKPSSLETNSSEQEPAETLHSTSEYQPSQELASQEQGTTRESSPSETSAQELNASDQVSTQESLQHSTAEPSSLETHSSEHGLVESLHSSSEYQPSQEIQSQEPGTTDEPSQHLESQEQGTAEEPSQHLESQEQGTTEEPSQHLESQEQGTTEEPSQHLESQEQGTTEEPSQQLRHQEQGTTQEPESSLHLENHEQETAQEPETSQQLQALEQGAIREPSEHLKSQEQGTTQEPSQTDSSTVSAQEPDSSGRQVDHFPLSEQPRFSEHRFSEPFLSEQRSTPAEGARSKPVAILKATRVTSAAVPEPETEGASTLYSNTNIVQPPPQEPLRQLFPETVQNYRPFIHDNPEESDNHDQGVDRRDFALPSSLESAVTRHSSAGTQTRLSPASLDQSMVQEPQNAQVLSPAPSLSTQDESVESIRPTIESGDIVSFDEATSSKRYDSSQQSLELTQEQDAPVESTSSTLSLPPHPPPHSLDVSQAVAPPQLLVPSSSSSSSPSRLLRLSVTMAERSRQESEDAEVKAATDSFLATLFNPAHFKVKKSVPATASPSASGGSTQPPSTIPNFNPAHFKVKKSVPATASPSASGGSTQPPSTIPNQSPIGADPLSLRTTALLNSTALQVPDAPTPTPAPRLSEATKDKADHATALGVSDGRLNASEQSDADEVAPFIDDIELLRDEHIIPLAMEGIQRNKCLEEITRRKELFEAFLGNPAGCDRVEDVAAALQTVQAAETHIDLICTETALSEDEEPGAQTRNQWHDSCVKFTFLDEFLRRLRGFDVHVIIALEEEDDRLFAILEKFLKDRLFNYKCPSRNKAADWSDFDGTVKISLLAAKSRFLVEPPDVICCLNGASATEIRGQNWARNPDQTVPILQLIIPRSVSHIKLCLNTQKNQKSQLHTLVASLAQIRKAWGQPLVDSPRPLAAAELVAEYVMKVKAHDKAPEWPLPPIHNVSRVIEYIEVSQESRVSTQAQTTPPPVSSKRPLDKVDNEDLEPSKRQRTTPSGEISHISNSMPSTAADELTQLRAQVASSEATLDRRQTQYEDLSQRNGLALRELETSKVRLDRSLKAKENVTQRYEKVQNDLTAARHQLAEQQRVDLSSEDEKTAEITRLRAALAEEKAAKESAIKNRQSAESTLEYLKDDHRKAQEAAAAWKASLDALEKEAARLRHKASGELSATKAIFYSANYEALEKKNELQAIENKQLRRQLEKKDEELRKIKELKKTYGTRQTSVPRSPRVGGPNSRATSPLPANRDRVSNLRKE